MTKISSIKRPVSYISLQGIVTTIHSNSGLIRDATDAALYFLLIETMTTMMMITTTKVNAQTIAQKLKGGDRTLESLDACSMVRA